MVGPQRGLPLATEELLGVLKGLTTSIRQRLTKAWKRTSTESPRRVPVDRADQYPYVQRGPAGLQTLGVG